MVCIDLCLQIFTNTEIYDIYQIWYQSKTRVDMFEFSGPGASWSWITGKAQICMTARRRFFLGVKSVGEAGTRLEIRHEIFLSIFFLRNFSGNRINIG